MLLSYRIVASSGGGRGRERERGREAERQRGREAERQRGREAERQRGREAERQRGKETQRQRDRGTEGQTGRGQSEGKRNSTYTPKQSKPGKQNVQREREKENVTPCAGLGVFC